MNDNYGYICPSLHSPLIGKVIKYQKSTGFYLLQMPKKKKNEEDTFYYCNVDLHDFIDEWVEIKILEYTMYSRKEEINILNKTEMKRKNYYI